MASVRFENVSISYGAKHLGYVPLREQYDNSVSHALEYYIADNALSRIAAALGKKEDARPYLFARKCKSICKVTLNLNLFMI